MTATPCISALIEATYIPTRIQSGIKINMLATNVNRPEEYLGGIERLVASCAVIRTLALMASSMPPLTPRAATEFTGALLIHFFIFLPSPETSATSNSSSSIVWPSMVESAKTLGSCESLSNNSFSIDLALCQSPLSIRHRAAAILGRTPVGSALTSFKEISSASSCIL